MGGSSVGRVIKILGGVQQNWAGQCEIVGGYGYRAIVLIPGGRAIVLIPAGGLGEL